MFLQDFIDKMPALLCFSIPRSGGLFSFLSTILLVADALLFIYCVPSVAYCSMLLMSAMGKCATKSKNIVPGDAGATRFCLIIPAHDEAQLIGETVARLSKLSYPPSQFRCIVVADNCVDETASIVESIPTSFAMQVLKRNDTERRGKGYALNYALDEIAGRRDVDAVAIIDADTHIDPDFLSKMDEAFQSCQEARTTFIAQGYYKVLNVSDNWRTALMAGALSLVHYVRPLARERWGCSVGLKGNGMSFGFDLAQSVRWRVDSITEDIDYTLDVFQKHKARVRFVPDAIVSAEMPISADAAQGQRRRWEQGRAGIVRRRAMPMMLQGLSRLNRQQIDIATDLICPPLAQMGIGVSLFIVVSAIMLAFHVPTSLFWAISSLLCAVGMVVYVLLGFKVANAPPEAYRALKMALFYVPWKIKAIVATKPSATWNKTERNSQAVEPEERSDRVVNSKMNGSNGHSTEIPKDNPLEMTERGVGTK